MKQNVLHSPRLLELKKQRRKIFFIRIFSILALSLFLVIGVAYLSRLKQLSINEIRISGNKVAEKKMIEEAVQSEMSGYYLWFFAKNNIFLYPKKNIETKLQGRFERLRSVNLSIIENQVLLVDVTEREGLYIWCGMDLPVATNQKTEKCYFLDENGYIFSEAPYFSGEVYFKYYGLIEEGGSNPIGSHVLKGNFNKLIAFKNTLEDMELKPVAVHVKDKEELRIYLSKGKSALLGPEIIFSINADLNNLAENLETALSTEPMLTNFKNKYSSLEYIDLRFGNKVYYRFR